MSKIFIANYLEKESPPPKSSLHSSSCSNSPRANSQESPDTKNQTMHPVANSTPTSERKIWPPTPIGTVSTLIWVESEQV